MGHPHITVFYRLIIQWSQDGIITSDSSPCATDKIIINFADESILAVNSPRKLPTDQAKACKFFGATGTGKSAFVVKGTDK